MFWNYENFANIKTGSQNIGTISEGKTFSLNEDQQDFIEECAKVMRIIKPLLDSLKKNMFGEVTI